MSMPNTINDATISELTDYIAKAYPTLSHDEAYDAAVNLIHFKRMSRATLDVRDDGNIVCTTHDNIIYHVTGHLSAVLMPNDFGTIAWAVWHMPENSNVPDLCILDANEGFQKLSVAFLQNRYELHATVATCSDK